MDFLRMPAYQLFLHPITGGVIWGYVVAMIYLHMSNRFPQYKAHFYGALAVLIYVVPLAGSTSQLHSTDLRIGLCPDPYSTSYDQAQVAN